MSFDHLSSIKIDLRKMQMQASEHFQESCAWAFVLLCVLDRLYCNDSKTEKDGCQMHFIRHTG